MEQHTIDVDKEDQHEHEQEKGRDADDHIRRANIQRKITQGIESLHPLPKEPCIFKVHQELRQVNEKAYTPLLVSIGPYHHGNPKFDALEEHKRRYLDLLLKRTNQGVEPYLEAMMKLEHRARNYYAHPFDHMGENDFVEVLLLDGCFVIEFLRKTLLTMAISENGKEIWMEILAAQFHLADDPIFKESWMATKICRDLMLLENQLPFFVLSELYDMTQSLIPNNIPFFELTQLIVLPIMKMLPREDHCWDATLFSTSCHKSSKHFLDLVHNVCRPSSKEISSCNYSRTSNNNVDDNKICMHMPCAMELREAGVKFKAVEEEDSAKFNMFDLKFEWDFEIFRLRRMLTLPKFKVTDATETFFRNIIAYEQHSIDAEPKYFTDYTYFMDLLINSREDVKQLCRCDVIENMLGDEEEVARMFNKLGDGIIQQSFYYSELCKKVNAHCDRWWNKATAKLKRDYFNNPWASVSTMAAAFLILLTLLQTLPILKSFNH